MSTTTSEDIFSVEVTETDFDGDGVSEGLYSDIQDLDGNGVGESYLGDLDDDGVVDTFLLDTDEDGYFETVAVDTDGSGLPETFVLDLDADGTFESTMTVDESIYGELDSSFDDDFCSSDSGGYDGFDF